MNRLATGFLRVSVFILLALTVGGVSSVSAQTQGWSEEFRLAQANSLDNRISMPAVSASGDNVYIVYRQGTIRFIRSSDRGKTWSTPIDIAPDVVGNSAPAIVVTDSRIVVVWPTLIEVEGLTAYQLVTTESRDGGTTWSPVQQITSTRDDTFSPRLLSFGDRILLMWMETPLSETLGSLSMQQRLSLSPDSVSLLQENIFSTGGVEQAMRRMQATIYTSLYNPSTSNFNDGTTVESFNSQRLPTIFLLYGPQNGNVYLTFNQNTTIKTYESANGQNWEQHFENREYFDTRQMLDVMIRDNEKYSVWIQRTFDAIPVMLREPGSASSLQLSPQQNVRAVPKMADSDGDFHIVWEAGQAEASWITYIRSDDVAPTATITAPDSPDIEDRIAMIQWDGEDNISADSSLSYSWRYGERDWSELQSENVASFPSPPDGEYTFQVRTEDWAGNIQNPVTEFTFNTFLAAPQTTLVSPPPLTQPVTSRSVTIRFTQEDNNDPPTELEYSARANEGEWTAFARGTQHTFTNLSNGMHTLSIRSRDSRGNIEEDIATCSVMVSVGLDLSLTEVPEAITNAETVTLAWQATDDQGNNATLARYYYQLNDGDPVLVESESVELSGLDEGAYEVVVWGEDASGDQTPRVSASWILDRTPPDTEAVFTKTYQVSFPVIRLQANDVPLADGSTSGTPTRYEYQIGDGDWVAFTQAGSNWPVERPLAFYQWGYVVHIRAIDNAGNVDMSPATVDLTLFSRSNPYILYPVLLVIAAAILVPVYMFFPRDMFARRRPASTSLSDSSSFDTDDTFGSTGSDDDDPLSFLNDDDKKD